jgi:site-specific recombinase XerD
MNIQGFLTHLQTRGYSTGSIVSYRSELQMFQAFLREQHLQVNQVKPLHMEKYIRWRDRNLQGKPSSVRRRLAAISSFYDFLAVMANGHIRNPVRPLRRPRRQPPRPKPLDEQQVATLTTGVTDARDIAILSLLLHSGLRLSELCSLDRDSIRVEKLEGNRVIGVGRVIGKGQREREFLVDLKTLKLVHEYLTGRPSDGISALFLSNRNRRINQRTIQHMVRAWCRKLDLPMLHPHQLRATYATRLNKVGVPTLEISKLLGHSNLDTTMQYIKPDMRRIRTEFFAAYEKLNP